MWDVVLYEIDSWGIEKNEIRKKQINNLVSIGFDEGERLTFSNKWNNKLYGNCIDYKNLFQLRSS